MLDNIGGTKQKAPYHRRRRDVDLSPFMGGLESAQRSDCTIMQLTNHLGGSALRALVNGYLVRISRYEIFCVSVGRG